MTAISVIIPLYNGATYIERTLDSILSQSVLPIEILVVDDGSTDQGPHLVSKRRDSLVRLIRQSNAGVSAARNRGMQEAAGNLLAFLDADDTWEKKHLETIVRLIDRYPHCGVFGTSYYLCKPGEEKTLPQVPNRFSFATEDGILDNYFILASGINPPLHMSSYCVRKEQLSAIGGFPLGVPAGEDTITMARLHATCDIAYSRRPTSTYYLYPSENKKPRPVVWNAPIDKMFNELLHTAKHRKGVRLFVSSWHKGRMVGALLSRQYLLALREWIIACCIYPFQKKLYTAFLATTYALLTKRSLYELNQTTFKKKKS